MTTKDPCFTEVRGDGPIVAVAQHGGHALRDEVERLMVLSDADRLREEDPFTDQWTSMAPTRLVFHRSRFEVDLNRPRHLAVYRTPAQSWGLDVWHEPPPPDDVVERSLREYDEFYAALRRILEEKKREHGRFVVLDIHSYNHRRNGPDAPPEDPEKNPQFNIGTGTMVRARWKGLVDRFITDLRAADLPGGAPDVRENVKFYGLNLPMYVHYAFPESGCALAVEVKKFFMDEWTGTPDQPVIDAVGEALRSTVPGLLEELGRV